MMQLYFLLVTFLSDLRNNRVKALKGNTTLTWSFIEMHIQQQEQIQLRGIINVISL